MDQTDLRYSHPSYGHDFLAGAGPVDSDYDPGPVPIEQAYHHWITT